MSAPRRVPLLRWEPLPYLVVFALLLGTGVVRPEAPAPLFWGYNAVLAVAVLWLLFAVFRPDRQRNPDRWGGFDSFDGVELVDAPAAPDRDVRAVAAVDVRRRRSGLDLARIHGGAVQHAVLVPRSRRWQGVRYRVGVVLDGGGRPRQAGYLPAAIDERRRDLLDRLAGSARYVRVPAVITGDEAPYGLDLDLSGLDAIATREAGGTAAS